MRRVGSGSCRRKRSRHCTESDWNEGEKILYFIFYIVPIHVGGSEEKTFRDISSAMYHLLPEALFSMVAYHWMGSSSSFFILSITVNSFLRCLLRRATSCMMPIS